MQPPASLGREPILDGVAALCLSIHADYACRHAGACCSAWMVPADPHVVELVASGRLRTLSGPNTAFVSAPNTSRGADLRIAHRNDGVCIFREAHRCSIHAQAGESALPVSCRHYPRVILRDPRGTRISLSHYCPTAASLLLDTRALEVVEAAGRMPVAEPMEGLDARDALPPLVRPGMLADLEGYYAWEAACIQALARGGDALTALNVISRATDAVRVWTPADGPLVDRVAAAFDAARAQQAPAPTWDVRIGGKIVRSLLHDAPDTVDLRPMPLAPHLEHAAANYLAARVFGNWISYQGRGLRSIVAWLHLCHDMFRAFAREITVETPDGLVSAVRQTDFLLLHTLDSQAFARAAASVEN